LLGLGCPKQAFAKIATPRLGLFNLPEFHAGYGAFGLCHKVNVLNNAFLE
jgi:hypothetical protein